MSHTDNSIPRQTRRHRGPLIGMVVVGLFVAVLFVWWLGYEMAAPGGDPAPETPAPVVEGAAPTIEPETPVVPAPQGTGTVTP